MIFYFSFRSPYSWIGYRDLLEHYPDVAAVLQWRPFWEPEPSLLDQLKAGGDKFPYVDMSRPKALYILQDVRRLTRQRGLTPSWPVDRAPRWEVAHLAYLLARRQGAGPQFIAGIYQARWENGLNISDPQVIGKVGAAIGLDPKPLTEAADDPALRAEGLIALQAIARDGVFGVPFFIHGHDKFWGVDRLAEFAASVRGEGNPVAVGDVSLEGASADMGHAGGCG